MYLIFSLALFWATVTAQDAPCTETCWQTCPVDSRCPSINAATATVLPHLTNCNKFIKCQSGHGCVHDCPAGLHFNAADKTCDWPNRACCDPSVQCGPDDTFPGNCVTHVNCPLVNPVKPILLPHTVCSNFYKCDRGKACEYTCPDGLHFNERELACDWPWRACCDPSIECYEPCPTCPPSGTTPALTTTTPPTTTTTTTTTSTTTTTTPTTTTTTTTTPQPTTTTTTTTTPQPTTTTTTTTTQAPTTPPPDDDSCNVCPINCVLDSRCPLFNPSKPVLLPHSECTKFYKCETGRACELECPAGLHFNAAKMVCDWPWHACCDPNVECVIPCIPGVTCPPTLG